MRVYSKGVYNVHAGFVISAIDFDVELSTGGFLSVQTNLPKNFFHRLFEKLITIFIPVINFRDISLKQLIEESMDQHQPILIQSTKPIGWN